MSAFTTPLRLEFLDGKNWLVTEAFEYHLGAEDSLEWVRIQAGFVTDFASIPRGLWNIFPPTGGYGKAAVVHDWLYRRRIIEVVNGFTGVPSTRLCDRGEADRILREGMDVLGCAWMTRQTIYWTLRAAGWKAWRDARKKEESYGPAIL